MRASVSYRELVDFGNQSPERWGLVRRVPRKSQGHRGRVLTYRPSQRLLEKTAQLGHRTKALPLREFFQPPDSVRLEVTEVQLQEKRCVKRKPPEGK